MCAIGSWRGRKCDDLTTVAGGIEMSKTITKTYQSVGALHNVREDLVATGIDQEEIYVDEGKRQVKVVFPATIEPEIVEILDRHQPLD